jgi:hypothetical protein
MIIHFLKPKKSTKKRTEGVHIKIGREKNSPSYYNIATIWTSAPCDPNKPNDLKLGWKVYQ